MLQAADQWEMQIFPVRCRLGGTAEAGRWRCELAGRTSEEAENNGGRGRFTSGAKQAQGLYDVQRTMRQRPINCDALTAWLVVSPPPLTLPSCFPTSTTFTMPLLPALPPPPSSQAAHDSAAPAPVIDTAALRQLGVDPMRAKPLSEIMQQMESVRVKKHHGQSEGEPGPDEKAWKAKFVREVPTTLASLCGDREVCEGVVYQVIQKLAESGVQKANKFHVVDPFAARFMPGQPCGDSCRSCNARGLRSRDLAGVSSCNCAVRALSRFLRACP